MKKTLTIAIFCFLSLGISNSQTIDSQWKGKRVAFLGDSITDARQVATTNETYWSYLPEILGIEPYVYGISGHRMDHIKGQAEKLEAEHGQAVDVIIVFVGTNDFNQAVPLGDWYNYSDSLTIKHGKSITLRHRELIYDGSTFRGRTNITMRHLKTRFPDKQIILLTPIHRAYFEHSEINIQPNESFANERGLFIDDYVDVVKETANVWAVPVIDLNSLCGLYPMADEHAHYFRNASKDRLHPNSEGHLRMAWTLAYQLLALPAVFQ